ncbi:MAG: phosphonate ABC transporter, permease protein PhnE [Candidatus Bipolaricaulia bacterium]
MQTLKRRLTWAALLVALGATYAVSIQQLEFSLAELIQKSPRFFDLMGRMWPPRWDILPQIWKPLLETIRIAVLGTTLGAAVALPMMMLSTRSVTRAWWLYYPARAVIGVLRSIPDLLYAALFVAALGIGPVAGVPALTLFSIGIIAKLTSESADNIDRGPVEALEATGARRPAVVTFAVLPQVLPMFLSYSLYMFEINVRAATILAYVGAGGIGQNLITALDWFDYPAAMTILIVIFGFVFLIDLISSRFRQAFVEGRDLTTAMKGGLGATAVALMIWAVLSIDIDLQRVSEGLVYFGSMLTSMVQPAWQHLPTAIAKMAESIEIALLGTTVAALLAFPFGFLCARNLGIPSLGAYTIRQAPNAIRTFPEIILAIFLIAAFGPGPMAGVLALGIHSIGMISRLNYEIVETIDRGPLEALGALGSAGVLRFRYAVLPQVIPEFLAIAIYRFEINVRAATVLGVVGAGGIGQVIMDAVRQGRWNEVGVYMFVVLVSVMIIDYLSSISRRRLIEG